MPKSFENFSLFEKIRRSKKLLPVIILILAVIGSIYTGIATATEAASLGVVGALLLSYLQKSLTIQTFKESLLGYSEELRTLYSMAQSFGYKPRLSAPSTTT